MASFTVVDEYEVSPTFHIHRPPVKLMVSPTMDEYEVSQILLELSSLIADSKTLLSWGCKKRRSTINNPSPSVVRRMNNNECFVVPDLNFTPPNEANREESQYTLTLNSKAMAAEARKRRIQILRSRIAKEQRYSQKPMTATVTAKNSGQ